MSTITELNPRLLAITEAGVSVWLDQIRRSMVEGGELARMVAVESLRGVTSNPSIFEKAILGSTDYDDDLRTLARENLDSVAIYEHIAIRDVQLAADVLAGVHRDARGRDGFVSLEVAPDLAHDTEGTLEQVRAFWKRVDRANVMIKIPGTPEGVPAIEQALYEGINVNVTLLFSVAAYEGVAEAYLRALERRHAEGLVARRELGGVLSSSRAWTRPSIGSWSSSGAPTWRGRRRWPTRARRTVGSRSCSLVLAGMLWSRRRRAVQRPLWASTGTKNPHYPDTMYVDGLVARAHREHDATGDAAGIRRSRSGEWTDGGGGPERGPGRACRRRDRPRRGHRRAARRRRQAVRGGDGPAAGRDRGTARGSGDRPAEQDPCPAPAAVAAAGRRSGADEQWPRTLRSAFGDATRRCGASPGVPEIEDRLGWLTVSEPMLEHAVDLEAFADSCRRGGFTDAVLLGMGGSSLGPEVIRRSFGPVPDGLRLTVLDSTHPDVVLGVRESLELERTLFIVSSKSGSTIETLSQYQYFKSLAQPEQFVVITDPGTPLERLASDNGLRRCFLNPPDIGGRYSVLSYFGLVPAALMGVNIEALLHRCQVAEQMCAHYDSSESNSGLWFGAVIGELARQGRDKLTFLISPPIESFGLWAEQLVAESTGKHGRGIVPVVDEPLGDSADVYGDDRVFVYRRNLRAPRGAPRRRDRADLRGRTSDDHAAGARPRRPRAHLLPDRVRGRRGGVGARDQPVRPAERAGGQGQHGAGAWRPARLPSVAGSPATISCGRCWPTLRPPHYVAILGYVPPSAASR